MLEGVYRSKGISPPEYFGARLECFERIMADLDKRGVHYQVEESDYE